MSRSNLVTKFLNELNSEEVKSAMEHLTALLEILEEKVDPEPIEMTIVDEAFKTIEQIKVLENALRNYQQVIRTLDGDKLSDLYSNKSKILF